MTSLANAVKSGKRKEVLEATQAYLADALDACTSDRDKAALSRQLIDVTNQLAAEELPEEDSPAERIRRASEARKAAQEATNI